jgi:L-threonylcarbamoyladenylate synthase
MREGRLVVFPTETVYGLGADAENEASVRRIYEVKGRPLNHPLIVHIGEFDFLENWISGLPDYALELARNFWPGSMTLVLPRSDRAKNFITGGQESIGVRLPSHPVALQLLEEFHNLGGLGVAAPSANRFGEVSPTTASAAEQDLGEYLQDRDFVLDGGPCVVGIESTVIDCRGSRPRVIRPGAITSEMIIEVTGLDLITPDPILRVSGALENHYAPRASVVVGNAVIAESGFIAMSPIPTPPRMERIFAPTTVEEFARGLYGAFRKVDQLGLKVVVVIPPTGDGLELAIRDRIEKARSK